MPIDGKIEKLKKSLADARERAEKLANMISRDKVRKGLEVTSEGAKVAAKGALKVSESLDKASESLRKIREKI